jgi:hypothetical protein
VLYLSGRIKRAGMPADSGKYYHAVMDAEKRMKEEDMGQ